jgi:hypothetical protein
MSRDPVLKSFRPRYLWKSLIGDTATIYCHQYQMSKNTSSLYCVDRNNQDPSPFISDVSSSGGTCGKAVQIMLIVGWGTVENTDRTGIFTIRMVPFTRRVLLLARAAGVQEAENREASGACYNPPMRETGVQEG